jgi:hypothetical protein
MAVPQQLVIERIRARCEELEERYDGYRRDLVTYLAEVLSYERAGTPQIAKQVERQLDAFGDLFDRETSSPAPAGDQPAVSNATESTEEDGGAGQ